MVWRERQESLHKTSASYHSDCVRQDSCQTRASPDVMQSETRQRHDNVSVITSSVVELPFSFSHVTAKRASCVVTLLAKGKLHTATFDAGGGPVRHCAHRTITLRSVRGDVSITLTSVSSRITATARHTSACGQCGSALPRRTLFHKKLVMWSVRGYPASPPCHSTAQRVVRD